MPKILAPEEFICPLTRKLINDPVVTCDGQLYERQAIEEWLKTNDINPVSKLPLKNKELISLPFLKRQIQSFVSTNQVSNIENFFDVIEKGDISKLKQLNFLEYYLQEKTDSGRYPLHCAAQYGHDDIVDYLLINQADIEAKANENFTPLHVAAHFGHPGVVKKLLNAKACLEAVGEEGQTPLHLAITGNKLSVVKLLITAGANPNAVMADGGRPLHIAAVMRPPNEEIVRSLLAVPGIDIEATSSLLGMTPLLIAVLRGHITIVKLLLDAKAKTDIKDKEGRTPRIIAYLMKYEAVLALLNEYGEYSREFEIEIVEYFTRESSVYLEKGEYETAIKNLMQIFSFLEKGQIPASYLLKGYYSLGCAYLKLY
jgi:ankyrin repeat protein